MTYYMIKLISEGEAWWWQGKNAWGGGNWSEDVKDGKRLTSHEEASGMASRIAHKIRQSDNGPRGSVKIVKFREVSR
jgi:hypothetical protein